MVATALRNQLEGTHPSRAKPFRTELFKPLPELEVLLSKVLPSIFHRVRGRIREALRIGAGFLHLTKSEGQESSSGGACAGLQADQDHLEMLADAHEV
jgi:hypothetical protein